MELLRITTVSNRKQQEKAFIVYERILPEGMYII